MSSTYLTDPRDELWRAGLTTLYRVRSAGGVRHALRLLAPEAPREPFERETELLRALAHPNIVPLLDAGEADGMLYQVYPAVDTNLRLRLRGGTPMAVPEALAVARPIGEALVSLHSQCVVHCDVTPAAVWFAAGKPMLAHFQHATAAGTVTSVAHGTPAYWSPEQRRDGASVDPRWDVWALGLMLYEMLAGSLPAHPHSASASRRLGTLSVSEDLQVAISKALAEYPDARFTTMHAFLDALAAA